MAFHSTHITLHIILISTRNNYCCYTQVHVLCMLPSVAHLVNFFSCNDSLSMIVIVTKLDGENKTLLDSCIEFYMFTNISDMYTQYSTYKNSANIFKCHKFGNWNKYQKENPRHNPAVFVSQPLLWCFVSTTINNLKLYHQHEIMYGCHLYNDTYNPHFPTLLILSFITLYLL